MLAFLYPKRSRWRRAIRHAKLAWQERARLLPEMMLISLSFRQNSKFSGRSLRASGFARADYSSSKNFAISREAAGRLILAIFCDHSRSTFALSTNARWSTSITSFREDATA